MSLVTSANGFVPPYFFNQLSKFDSRNKNFWGKCYEQSLRVFEQRAQEPQLYFSAQLPSNLLPKVTVLPNDPRDPNVEIAKKNGEIVLEFLQEILGRNSFDDRGTELKIHLHAKEYDENAVWSNNAVYIGDTSDERYTTLAKDIDIIGHETVHGVVQYTANFKYQGQSGALNESLSDVIGSMIKQYSKNQKAGEADWLIGDEYVKDLPEEIRALRSMKEPGKAYKFSESEKDPQVENMNERVDLNRYKDRDHEGVHIYSGIPNKVFCIFAMVFPYHYSWEVAGQIWYGALCSCGPETTFVQFAQATLQAVNEVGLPSFTTGIDIKRILSNSWRGVGIEVPVAPSLQRSIRQPDIALPFLLPQNRQPQEPRPVANSQGQRSHTAQQGRRPPLRRQEERSNTGYCNSCIIQ